jgi:hypothetical protein
MISRFVLNWSFSLEGEFGKSCEQRLMTIEIRNFEMAFTKYIWNLQEQRTSNICLTNNSSLYANRRTRLTRPMFDCNNKIYYPYLPSQG